MTSKTSDEHVLTVASSELAKGIEQLGLSISADGQARLLQYLVLLEKWNQVYNLTAIRDLAKMVSAHLLDSLSVVPFLEGHTLLDVGTGAGLPGIPIALAEPDRQVTLLDSSHKKTAFLRQAIADLGLQNAAVACERVESWQSPRQYDVIISRAFADLGEFVSLTQRLLAPGGVFAAMKGVYPYEEMEHLPSGYRVREVKPLQVPGLNAERHLALVVRV